MKRIVLLIVLCLVFLTSCIMPKGTPGNENTSAAQDNSGTTKENTAQQPEADISDYFPFLKDVHIVYKGTGNEFASLDRYVDYVNGNRIQFRDSNGGTVAVNVYELNSDSLKRVYSRGETYFRADYTSMDTDDEILIKAPLKMGTEWILKDGAIRTITGVDLIVPTPIGDIKALEVTTKRPDSVEMDYYGKGIGLIKKVYRPNDSPESIISTDIEKLEKNVPFSTDVRFYYPDYDVEKIYYLDKPVELYTNDDPNKTIGEELKKRPGNSGPVRVLTPGADVIGVKIDENKNAAVVDFTPELVTEMNAGAGFESMILSCIADTFGSYYQVSRVGITLDGEPYSSGHIILNPGEYIDVKTDQAVEY